MIDQLRCYRCNAAEFRLCQCVDESSDQCPCTKGPGAFGRGRFHYAPVTAENLRAWGRIGSFGSSAHMVGEKLERWIDLSLALYNGQSWAYEQCPWYMRLIRARAASRKAERSEESNARSGRRVAV